MEGAIALQQVAIIAVIAVVVGIIIGRLTKKDADQAEIKTELEQAKTELTQHRQELVTHFANSAELLENIYRDYSELCKIMAKSSTELLPDQAEQDNPFAKRLAHAMEAPTVEKDAIELPEAPRDYSEQASGLLATEEAKSDAVIIAEASAEMPIISEMKAEDAEPKVILEQASVTEKKKEAIEKVE